MGSPIADLDEVGPHQGAQVSNTLRPLDVVGLAALDLKLGAEIAHLAHAASSEGRGAAG